MSRENHDKLTEIVATLLEIDAASVTDETSPETHTQWDSMAHLNICLAVSEEFGVPMTTAEMAAMTSVGAIAGHLKVKGVAFE